MPSLASPCLSTNPNFKKQFTYTKSSNSHNVLVSKAYLFDDLPNRSNVLRRAGAQSLFYFCKKKFKTLFRGLYIL